MGTRLFADNAVSALAAGISNIDLSLTVQSGHGALFPSPTGGDWFALTLTQSSTETSWEIIKVTARVGDVLTIVRAQEGTVAATWPINSLAEARLTATALGPAVANDTNGFMTGADKAKLDGIAAGATAVTNNNQLINGAGYVTSAGSVTYASTAGAAPASDVSAWAKAATKPAYTAAEVGAPSGSGTSTGTNTGDNTVSTSGNATTLGGLAYHNTQSSQTAANQILRTQANGYTMLGWINTTSGDSGVENRLARIYCSYDSYVRYLGLTDFKIAMGLSAKNNYSRRIDYTSDSNYWTGVVGHSGLDMNGLFNAGACFFDVWAGSNFPPGTSHVHGFQALHYTAGTYPTAGGSSYGIQVCGQYGQDGVLWMRSSSAGSFTSWRQLITNVSGNAVSATTAASCTGNAATATYAYNCNSWFYLNSNYGHSIVGVYSSTVFQGVFAMGDAYKLTAGGGINNLYGITWSYPSAGGIAGNLASHGLIVAINGGFGSCMSYNIVASQNITAYSDERLKTNWRYLPDDFVEKLAGVKTGVYDRTEVHKDVDGNLEPVVTQVGVSAQSLRPVMPFAITVANDEMKTLGVNYGGAALASCVMISRRVVNHETRIKELEAEVAMLRKAA